MSSQTVLGKEVFDSKLEKPFRLLIGGGSGSGKTTFLKKLVNESHFETPFDKIIYRYPDYLQEPPATFDQIIEFQPGIGDLEYYNSLPRNTLVIFDDLMNECGNSVDIMRLFSVVARKQQLSLIFIVQNVYDSSKQFRNIRINATGMVLFRFYAASDVTRRMLRDFRVQSLITQRQLDEIYSKSFAYIFINLHPKRQSDFVAIRGNIFERNFSIYHKMEYVAIPKSDFLKHFKIAEVKDNTVRAIKDELEIRKTQGKRRSSRSTKRAKKRRRSPTPATSATEISESEYSG